MAKNKDPAFMFYPSDFMVGTFLMSNEEVGKYIRLLCLQHQQGHFTEEEFNSLGGDNNKIRAKFIQDDQGLYYNDRLDEEILKRAAYKDKLRANGSLGGKSKAKAKLEQSLSEAKAELKQGSSTRVENENINENVNVIKDIIEYLNTKLGTKYKSNAEYINKHINARLNEGFTLEDFKTVINKKYDEWAGTEMDKFLRPETLFGTKFQQYLNQRVVPKTEKPAEKPKQPPIERYGNFDAVKAFEAACARNFFDED